MENKDESQYAHGCDIYIKENGKPVVPAKDVEESNKSGNGNPPPKKKPAPDVMALDSDEDSGNGNPPPK